MDIYQVSVWDKYLKLFFKKSKFTVKFFLKNNSYLVRAEGLPLEQH